MIQVLLRWKDEEKGKRMPMHTLRTVTHKEDNVLVCMDFHDRDWQSPLLGVKLKDGKILESYEDSKNPKLQMYTREDFEKTFSIVEGSEYKIN